MVTGERRAGHLLKLPNKKKRGAKRPGDSAQHLALDGIEAIPQHADNQSAHDIVEQSFKTHKPLLSELKASSPRYNSRLLIGKFVVNRNVIVPCWWKMSRVAVGLCAPLIWSGRSTVGPVPLKHQTMDRHHPRLPHAGLAQMAERRFRTAQVEISKFSSSSRRRPCRAARCVFESRFDSATGGFDSLWCWDNRIRRLYFIYMCGKARRRVSPP